MGHDALHGDAASVVQSFPMRLLLFILAFTLFLNACTFAADSPGASVTLRPTPLPTAQASAESVQELPTSSPIPTASPSLASSSAVTVVESTAVAEPTDLPPDTAEAARRATALELINGAPPLRDDVRLAAAYRDASPLVGTPEPALELQPGATDVFSIGNVDSNTVSNITAELMSVGENAYFWFDTGEGSVVPSQTELREVTAAFDEIYTTLFQYFGMTKPADGKIHIVHASPNSLCDDPDNCRLAGYFSAQDLLPKSINPYSNERSMFVMNTRQFGSEIYLDVLAHETRHLLGNDYESGEEDWFVEGGAMLAEDLAGFSTLAQARGALFLENPDQQLNSWTDGNTIPYYGQGYLVNRFLYDRLGDSLYREFIFSGRTGLGAVDAVATANNLELTGDSLWLDWLVAMAVMDAPDVPAEFRWVGPEIKPVVPTRINNLPALEDTTVSQYAADYYELPSSGQVTFDFAGMPTVPLLPSSPPSGEYIWYAQRANDSNPRLTRTVDLRDVETATLTYQVYTDIEYGYDFAYASVSTDAGLTWQGLEANGMQGLLPEDDPSDKALTERFYTGREGQWKSDSVDLSPYAGQEILLRFEYVTDPIQTYGGFALDDIAIGAIGFADDAESLDEGWTAEGFTRATTQLPQTWWLQLITFDSDGRPSVERIAVPEEGRYQHTYTALPGQRRPILVVAALAPETLQSAGYSLDISSR